MPIQIVLHCRILHTTRHQINCIANRLSDEPKTARSVPADYASSSEARKNYNAMYTLSQNYGKIALRSDKPFESYGPDCSRIDQHERQKQNKRKRANPSWMRGVKGCFIS